MNCPSCNKFASLEMQDPEVNDLTLDVDSYMVSAEVRIVRNSACCGDEMKESTFNTETELPEEIVAKIEAIQKREDYDESNFEVEPDVLSELEEGGHRYKKSYYGYTLTVLIKYGDDELGKVELTDKIEASGMDELA
jgi:hypothetical protein